MQTLLNKKLGFSFILIALLFISACGFHPRGVQKLPASLNKLYVATDSPLNPFIQNLRLLLGANGIMLVDNAKHSTATLTIMSMQKKHQLTSLTGSNEAGQYTLYKTVEFKVTDTQGHILLAPTTVRAQRTYSSNASQILSASSVHQRLLAQMDQQLSSDILNRLAKIKTNNQ